MQPSQSTPPPAQTNPQYPQNPSQPQRSPLQQAPPPAKNVVEESLEDLRVQYDDAKINSVIIEQVKELITLIKELSPQDYDVHVTTMRNDFAIWIHESVSDDDVTQKAK